MQPVCRFGHPTENTSCFPPVARSLPIPGHLAKEQDWWVTPLNGGKAIKTGAREAIPGAVGLFDFFSSPEHGLPTGIGLSFPLG